MSQVIDFEEARAAREVARYTTEGAESLLVEPTELVITAPDHLQATYYLLDLLRQGCTIGTKDVVLRAAPELWAEFKPEPSKPKLVPPPPPGLLERLKALWRHHVPHR